MSVDFLLGEDGDIRLYMRLRSGDAVTIQRIKRRLLTFGPHRITPTDGSPPIVVPGEWILDSSQGLPLLDWRAQKPPDLRQIRAFVFAEIAATPGVDSVISVQAEFDRQNQSVAVTARVRLESGTVAALEFRPPLAGNSLPYVAILYPSLTVIP